MAFIGKLTAGVFGVILAVGGITTGSAGIFLIGMVMFTMGIGWDFIREQLTR